MQAIFETIFDIVYLLSVISLGIKCCTYVHDWNIKAF